MAILESKTPTHWNYFLALEDDFLKLARFVEPTTSNFATHSLEIARVLFSAASEVDVVAKLLCRKVNAQSKASSIGKYREQLLGAYPELAAAQVKIPRYGLDLEPWSQWQVEDSPLWWRAYNKVKHHRDSHFVDASLKHALNALAGLFVLLLFLYREEAEQALLAPDPRVFRVSYPFLGERLAFGPDEFAYRYVAGLNHAH